MSTTRRSTTNRRTTSTRSGSRNGRYSNQSSYRRNSNYSRNIQRRNQVYMIRRIIAVVVIAIIVAIAVFMFRGCSHATVGDVNLTAGKSAIYIQKDGGVMYGASEKFDKTYYDKGDLEDMIESEVTDFNNGPYTSSMDSCSLESFSVDDDVATVIMGFDSIDNYISYEVNCNGVAESDIFIGSITKVLSEDYTISGEFTKVIDKALTEEIVDTETVLSYDGNIIILKGQMDIQFEEASVNYVSSNCTIKDGIVSITDEEIAYIVYK